LLAAVLLLMEMELIFSSPCHFASAPSCRKNRIRD
jgi:hypothetical protein